MKNILVPVDLSKNSKEALRYAVHIAKKENATITIVHFYSLLLKAVIHTTRKGHNERSPEKWIKKRISKIVLKYPELQIEYKILKGDAVVSMQSVAKSIGADLLIIGCQGEREDSKTFLGSTAGGIMMTSKIPVMLIPPRFKYAGIYHVLIAAISSQVKKRRTLEPLQRIVESYKPEVNLLLFGQDHELSNNVSLKPLITHIEQLADDQHSSKVISYLSKHPTDLFTVIKRNKGVLEKTIGPKRTSTMRFHVTIPVLVLIEEYG